MHGKSVIKYLVLFLYKVTVLEIITNHDVCLKLYFKKILTLND